MIRVCGVWCSLKLHTFSGNLFNYCLILDKKLFWFCQNVVQREFYFEASKLGLGFYMLSHGTFCMSFLFYAFEDDGFCNFWQKNKHNNQGINRICLLPETWGYVHDCHYHMITNST